MPNFWLTCAVVLPVALCLYWVWRHTTKRADTTLELNRSREALARAQRISNVGSFERDLTTGETEFSEQFLRIHGLAEGGCREPLDSIRALVHPEDSAKVDAYRRASEQGRPPAPIDYRIIRSDGQIRFLHRECDVLFKDGIPVRLIGTLQDITERKEAEIEIAKSRASLANAQRIAGIGSFDHNLITNEAFWSDELYRLYGLSPEGGRGSRELAFSMIHPEDREKALGVLDQVNADGPSRRSVHFRIIRGDGEERILHRRVDVTFDQGRAVRVFGTLQDVTERHNAERELQRGRENLARAQRVAMIGSFEHIIATNSAEWSDEMFRILGIENSDAVPGLETLIALAHPDDRQRFLEHRAREISGETTPALEYRIVCPDGSEKIVRRENGFICDEHGKPVRRYGTLQDVTALRSAEHRERELERKLLQSQKLEALGTLAGGIAHDLNNNLVPIMALSKLAARKLDAADPIRTNLDTIYDASVRARDLVTRILAFSRNEASEKGELDLAAATREALKFLETIVPSTIRVQTDIHTVPAIFADATQIHQVVTNLLANAYHAIGNAIGTITVMVRTMGGARPEVCLSINDTGIGIDEATRQRIFEPFFTTKPVGVGSGLGLSIVHGIVKSHGGRIDVTSQPGKGTQFDIYFPPIAHDEISSSRPAA
ncbi:MAG TPA: PAS domain-containing protein [Stellaceae bacterium]|nr:PAS domain-containing protein [Stellaceae bacterium]